MVTWPGTHQFYHKCISKTTLEGQWGNGIGLTATFALEAACVPPMPLWATMAPSLHPDTNC
jgi:hypothetical protein